MSSTQMWRFQQVRCLCRKCTMAINHGNTSQKLDDYSTTGFSWASLDDQRALNWCKNRGFIAFIAIVFNLWWWFEKHPKLTPTLTYSIEDVKIVVTSTLMCTFLSFLLISSTNICSTTCMPWWRNSHVH